MNKIEVPCVKNIKIHDSINIFNSMIEDYIKYENGNKKSGIRARKYLLCLQKNFKEIRMEILEKTKRNINEKQ